MLKRMAKIGTFTIAFVIALSAWAAEIKHEPSATPAGIPAYVPRFDRAQPVVAVVAENSFTELTDYVVPYGVLSASGAAKVVALATQSGPVQMFPALRLMPQATTAEFDTRFPDGADYVIVPAVHRTDDPALLAWVRAQAANGATVVGICDGVWVVANAGLLAGRKAVGHWYSFTDLEKKFTDTRWVRDTRYLSDRKVVTTTGVTASIPVSLALVEAIAGRTRATALAREMGVSDWSTAHRSNQFKLGTRHALTAAGNWISVWRHENVGVPVANGVDEIALALWADAYSRTYRSSAYSLAPTTTPVTTLRGLVILPARPQDAANIDRVAALPPDTPPVAALDTALRDITQTYGAATANFVALQLEYPTRAR